MGYNAIEIDGEVKLDLSEDTVTEETLPEGVTAHDANGEPIQGKMKFVKSINGKTGDVTLNASDVGADDVGTAQSVIGTHNTNTDAHNDIRLELQRLSGIINDVLDSDDIDLNELHEIVAYIKSNSALIAAITVSKVNVADIINNLTTNVTDKPLSAAQGVELNKNKLDASKLAEAINTALAEAKASGEFDGKDGKSAYEYAKNGGYTGTETEFAEKLADEWQLKKDSNLKTESKEVVGAINELNDALYKNFPSEGLAYERTYSYDDNYAVCSNIGTCTDTQIVISSEYQDLPVREIGISAFDRDYYPQVDKITSIVVPNTVQRIEHYAFYNCVGLKSVFIPKSVTYIGSYAFYGNNRTNALTVYFEAESKPSTFLDTWDTQSNCDFVWGADITSLSKPTLSTKAQSIVGAVNEIHTIVSSLQPPSEDDSLVGTWVFNDWPSLRDVYDEFNFEFDMYGSGDVDTKFCDTMYVDGSDMFYCEGSDFQYYVFNDGDGWYWDEYKTIRITSEPTDTDFIAWLKENAKKQGGSGGGSGTYPDETDFFIGTWYFNSSVPLDYMNDDFNFTVDMYYGSSYIEETLYCDGMECDSSSELYYLGGSDNYFVADGSGGWHEEDYRTIHITTEPTDETIKQWIWENATKLEESYPDES